jgi:hypothetical protein
MNDESLLGSGQKPNDDAEVDQIHKIPVPGLGLRGWLDKISERFPVAHESPLADETALREINELAKRLGLY